MSDLRPVPEPETEFEELKRYVGFGEADEVVLATLQGPAEASLEVLLDRFYEVIDQHAGAKAVFTEPDAQRPRLRATLANWVRTLLRGPYDQEYADRRKAIGQVHVRVNLPQRYMLTAMNVVRRWFHEVCFEVCEGDVERLHAALRAVDRIIDIELAMMLGTYRDDLVARMQRQERLATIGELSAGIHHELKNPLAAIGANIFALGDRRGVRADPRARDMLERVRSNVDKATEIIGDLLSFTRLREPVAAPVALDGLVERSVQRVVLSPRCRLTMDLDPELTPARVDAAHLEQVLVNLLQNAVDACGDEGSIRVIGRHVEGHVHLSVQDDGVGIEASELTRVFEPLYSTKPDGVGLGLALSRHLVHANRGELSLKSTLGEGTTVTVVLPI